MGDEWTRLRNLGLKNYHVSIVILIGLTCNVSKVELTYGSV